MTSDSGRRCLAGGERGAIAIAEGLPGLHTALTKGGPRVHAHRDTWGDAFCQDSTETIYANRRVRSSACSGFRVGAEHRLERNGALLLERGAGEQAVARLGAGLASREGAPGRGTEPLARGLDGELLSQGPAGE